MGFGVNTENSNSILIVPIHYYAQNFWVSTHGTSSFILQMCPGSNFSNSVGTNQVGRATVNHW